MIDPMVYVTILQQTHELWRAVEHFEYDKVMALLTPDCRWKREGKWFEGIENIRASMEGRSTARLVRHILSDFVMERDGDGVVSRYLLAGVHSGGAPEKAPPYSTTNLRRIGDCADRLVETPEGWRFAVLEPSAIFVGG